MVGFLFADVLELVYRAVLETVHLCNEGSNPFVRTASFNSKFSCNKDGC